MPFLSSSPRRPRHQGRDRATLTSRMTNGRFGVGRLASPVIFAAITASAASAQEIPEFNKLRTPDSPAFTILGISPTQVQRPTTPSTFAASFLENFVEAGGVLPKSFALETTPFWWFGHPGLTLTDYEDPGFRSVYRNLSFSLATTTVEEEASDPADGTDESAMGDARRVALGLRTTLLPGRTASNACIGQLQNMATSISTQISGEVANAIALDPTLARDSVRLAAFVAGLEPLTPQREALKRETKACVDKLSARTGFVLDAATALALGFPEGRADDGEVTTAGAWLSGGYLTRSFSAVGLLRFRWDGIDRDTTASGVDLGLQTVYAHDRYALSIEGVWRHVSEGDETNDFFRVSLGFDVQLFGDTWLTTAFGRDFEADEANSLIALANLKWNVGSRSIQTPVP